MRMVARYYQAADLYIHAARADTFPNTILEALACGIPVIATAVGGIPEQIHEGKTGFLTPLGDASAMAGAIWRLLEDPDLRKKMGDAAIREVNEKFSLDLQVKRFLSWYEEIISNWK
jgi:glycosyltransferase involved in cell wall biosynthesis